MFEGAVGAHKLISLSLEHFLSAVLIYAKAQLCQRASPYLSDNPHTHFSVA